MLLHQPIEQRGLGPVPVVARQIEKWRRSARTGGDATDYDVKMSDGLGGPASKPHSGSGNSMLHKFTFAP